MRSPSRAAGARRSLTAGPRAGVFAAVRIPENTFAFWYTGAVSRNGGRDGAYVLRIDDGLVVDAAGDSSCVGRLVNAAPTPEGANLAFALDDDSLAPTPFRAPYLIAIRAIEAGEQLLVWYGPEYALPAGEPPLHEMK